MRRVYGMSDSLRGHYPVHRLATKVIGQRADFGSAQACKLTRTKLRTFSINYVHYVKFIITLRGGSFLFCLVYIFPRTMYRWSLQYYQLQINQMVMWGGRNSRIIFALRAPLRKLVQSSNGGLNECRVYLTLIRLETTFWTFWGFILENEVEMPKIRYGYRPLLVGQCTSFQTLILK